MSPHTLVLPPSTDWDEIRRWRTGVRDELIQHRAALGARRAGRSRRGRAPASPRRSISYAFGCSASAGPSAACSTCARSSSSISRAADSRPFPSWSTKPLRSNSGAGAPASPCRAAYGTSPHPSTASCSPRTWSLRRWWVSTAPAIDWATAAATSTAHSPRPRRGLLPSGSVMPTRRSRRSTRRHTTFGWT